MGKEGRVRDRMAHAAAPAAKGATIFWDARRRSRIAAPKNGGAPSSLTRPKPCPLDLEFCERAPPPLPVKPVWRLN